MVRNNKWEWPSREANTRKNLNMAHLSLIMNTILTRCEHRNDIEFKLESRHILTPKGPMSVDGFLGSSGRLSRRQKHE
jgi:hypothetical protein